MSNKLNDMAGRNLRVDDVTPAIANNELSHERWRQWQTRQRCGAELCGHFGLLYNL